MAQICKIVLINLFLNSFFKIFPGCVKFEITKFTAAEGYLFINPDLIFIKKLCFMIIFYRFPEFTQFLVAVGNFFENFKIIFITWQTRKDINRFLIITLLKIKFPYIPEYLCITDH